MDGRRVVVRGGVWTVGEWWEGVWTVGEWWEGEGRGTEGRRVGRGGEGCGR